MKWFYFQVFIVFVILTSSCAGISTIENDKTSGNQKERQEEKSENPDIEAGRTENTATPSEPIGPEDEYRAEDDVIRNCLLPLEHFISWLNSFSKANLPSWW